MGRGAVILLASLALFGCGKSEPRPDFDIRLNIQQVMKHVIDPAAISLWGRAGSDMTDGGEQDLAPTSEADWRAAENEAAIVAEGGNMLLLPGRVLKLDKDDMEWSALSRRMTDQALAVKAATEARDKAKMFETGGALYEACVACHARYYEPFLDAEGKKKTNAPMPEKPS